MPGDPFYSSPEWRRFRAIMLAGGLCEVPGCTGKAVHLDHKLARSRGGAPFDPANVQALCHPHHSEKTARSDRPSYRSSAKPLAAAGCDASGRPIDPAHHWIDPSRFPRPGRALAKGDAS